MDDSKNAVKIARQLDDDSNWRWRHTLFGEDLRVLALLFKKAFYVEIPLDGKDCDIQDSELRLLLDNLVAAQQALQTDAHFKLRDKVRPFVRNALIALAIKIAPLESNDEGVLPQSLESLISPKPMYYTLVPASGKNTHLVERLPHSKDDFETYDLAKPVDQRMCLHCHSSCSDPCTKPNALPHKHAPLFPDHINQPVPEYLDTDVMAIEWISRPYISKVEVPESGLSDPMICKVALDWHNSFSSTLREFQCLLAVSNANPSPSSPLSRIPKLMGIVRSSVHGGIIGLLETFVPNFSENMKGGRHRRVPYGTLSSFDLTIVDISRREKWIAQIHDTIQALHRVGATWGDVKSDNVLIHSRTDDAWLIDFGGCFTEGWGDPDTAETIEGDLSMEARLADYLRLGEQYRRRLEYK